jgi:hypothetical protein
MNRAEGRRLGQPLAGTRTRRAACSSAESGRERVSTRHAPLGSPLAKSPVPMPRLRRRFRSAALTVGDNRWQPSNSRAAATPFLNCNSKCLRNRFVRGSPAICIRSLLTLPRLSASTHWRSADSQERPRRYKNRALVTSLKRHRWAGWSHSNSRTTVRVVASPATPRTAVSVRRPPRCDVWAKLSRIW